MARLSAILDDVRAALAVADYARLDGLTAAMAQELTTLETSRNRPALLRLQRQAERNSACLLAAQRGLRAARRRMDDIRQARAGLVTYDLRGRHSELAPGGLLTRRV